MIKVKYNHILHLCLPKLESFYEKRGLAIMYSYMRSTNGTAVRVKIGPSAIDLMRSVKREGEAKDKNYPPFLPTLSHAIITAKYYDRQDCRKFLD